MADRTTKLLLALIAVGVWLDTAMSMTRPVKGRGWENDTPVSDAAASAPGTHSWANDTPVSGAPAPGTPAWANAPIVATQPFEDILSATCTPQATSICCAPITA